MPSRLKDLIRAVRQCKTAADERATIAKESAAIRTSFKEDASNEQRQTNIAKLLYIHMYVCCKTATMLNILGWAIRHILDKLSV